MPSVKDILGIYDKFKKRMGLPIVNIIFVIDLLILWKPQYSSLISANSWLAKSIQTFIIKLVTVFNSYYLIFLILILLFATIILLLHSWTPVFNLLPKDVEMTDDTVVAWNEVSAIRRLFSLFFMLLSNIWICWLTINIVLNPFDFVKEFYNYSFENKLLVNHYISLNMLITSYGLILLNAFITFIWVLTALFQIRIPIFNKTIKSNDLILYTELDSFDYNKDSLHNKTMILKKTIKKEEYYYIVSGHSILLKNVPDNNHIDKYEILNKSSNFTEIQYHFETLKSKHLNN
ncbi:hypothetical protein [Leuconostoc lactis]|uniref:hypothetical protein n=1 Tax=Leuconostoc lactis TaxID=1246 RepID=UPI001021AD1E|nr:hypothetical protein [Leuconostoc lactis]MSB65624.1 hypothetical protein [Leuconostoc lactis]RYS85000.1 hypothetical protein EAI73_08175 [Leuconostoc lactis]